MTDNAVSKTAVFEAFTTLHRGLPRQGPGSDATTRHLFSLASLAGPLPRRPRVLDLGCGPGRASLLLAAEFGAEVTAVDLYEPFLAELRQSAEARGLGGAIRTEQADMGQLPHPDGSFDLVWAESSAYGIGFDTALREWWRLLAPGGAVVVTECEWTADYVPHGARADAADPGVPGMEQALAATREEIAVRREHGAEYGYTGYALRPVDGRWPTRPETDADFAAVHAVNAAAFETGAEADLVDALRTDAAAWLPGLSYVATDPDGEVAAYALLTRCRVGDAPALALAPVAVAPGQQRRGAGAAVVRAVLDAARARGERLVLVLGHPEYYPKFGFGRASAYGIRPGFEVPDEAMMALVLDDSAPVAQGTIHYPTAFGV